MKYNHHLKVLVVPVILLALLFFSCNKEKNTNSPQIPDGKSELKIMMTDDPSVIYDSIFVDIQRVEVKVDADNGSDHWDTLQIRAGVYNILRFRNGLDTLLAVGYVANGEIEKIRITLGNNNAVVLNGVTIPVFPRKHEIKINVDDEVERIDNNHLRLWLDFDGHGSIRSRNGRLELDLRISHFHHHNSGELEGEIRPAAAFPVVMKIISGTDTLTAIPERDGEFKIRGIRSGRVDLLIKPSNGYRDSLIRNIPIRHGDDTELGTIRLRQ